MFRNIMDSCQFLLQNFPEANNVQEYLNNRVSEESQNNFKFGYFPSPEKLSVLTDLVGEESLKMAGLLFNKEVEDSQGPRSVRFSFFQNYPLVMAFRDTYGEPIAMVGRCLLDDATMKQEQLAKYKNTKFKKGNFVFGLYENKESILQEGHVYVVEGQFDVIKATENGLKNVVGVGSANMTSYQFSLISRYTNNIFMLLDNDEAGEKGRQAAKNKFSKLANIRSCYLPREYKDVDEYFQNNPNSDIPFEII